LIVLGMIYSIGDISGAHMNPAVTLGFALSGNFPGKQVLPYILSQIAGAMVASLFLKMLFRQNAHLGATLPSGSEMQSFLLEVFLTFLLMFVILRVSTGSKETGIMAGIAIASIVGLEACFAGPISGASMNPARSLAPALVSGHLNAIWIYLTAPCIGSALAVPVYKYLKSTP
jgi:aquaporin NIP